jgi:hypothetical protein
MPSARERLLFEHYQIEWKEQSLLSLQDEFTEAQIRRLTGTNPAKLIDLSQAQKILLDTQKLRFFACAPGGIRKDGNHVPAYIKGRGWKNNWQRPGNVENKNYYITSPEKIVLIDSLIEALEVLVDSLEVKNKQAFQLSKEDAKQFELEGYDENLASVLMATLSSLTPTAGFVYFKRWSMPDGSCWFKVGITNNPERRETEQNVLPVAAETIVCVDVKSMDRARAVEAVIHNVLVEHRITDANNRELFHLSDQQALAVKFVLEKLV